MSALEPIAIVGAGPVGLSCALMLHTQGISAQLFDAGRRDATRSDARVLALSRGSWRLLQPFLDGALLPRAPIESVRISSAGEFGQTQIAADHQEPLGATVQYGDLVTALIHAVERAGIALHFQSPIDDIAQHSDHISLRHGHDTLTAPLAIVAEGRPDTRPGAHSEQSWAIVTTVQWPSMTPGLAIERFTREGPLALLPLPQREGLAGALSVVWCMGQAECERRLTLTDADFLSELASAAGLPSGRPRQLGARHRFALSQHLQDPLLRHRVVRIGNAAQMLHPVAGQGFNLGLRDASVLAQSLAQHPAEQALQHFVRCRAADRRAISTLTRLLPAVFATHFAPLALARSAGLVALDWLPTLRHRLAHLLMFGVRQAT
ncbi:MAG TPA: FAD-dependent monooxygenase [Burkholderiaceae bacterium]|nr:FAD-dependent monooxygenase [Burkholderiaceae bacterium]